MKQKKRFPGNLWPFGKEKDLPPYISFYPGSVGPSDARKFWDEYKILIIIVIIAFLGIVIDALTFAQEVRPRPLKPGDPVPALAINSLLNANERSVNTMDYKDQLLILDFWSTSCATCVNEMPGVAGLIRRYAGRVKIIDIDYEPEKMVLAFYERRPEIKALGIPVAVNDRQLGRLFPHRFQPHIVWIDHGIYKGATEGGYLTAKNIDSVLDHPAVLLNQKVDLLPDDRAKPAFTINHATGLAVAQPIYSSIFTGYIRGKAPSTGIIRDSLSHTHRVFFYNQGIFNLYAYILKSPLPFQANLRILKVRDSSNYINVKKEYDDQYDQKHTYSFESVLPLTATTEQAYEQLRQAMETCLGISGTIEKKEVDVLALLSNGGCPLKSAYARQDVHDTPGLPIQLHHINAAYLAELLNDTKGMIPVIDETGTTYYFDIDMPAMPVSPEAWVRVLEQYGFRLVPGKKQLDLFVLTEHSLPGAAPSPPPTNKISN